MNKRLFFIFLFGIFIISFVSPLNCTYTEIEKFQELKLGIYEPNGDFFGEPLILKDFVSTYCGFSCGGKASFIIENQYSQEMHINLSALLLKPGLPAYPEAKSNIIQEIILPAYGEYKIEASAIGVGTNYFPNESISYTFINSSLILKKEMRQSEREVCSGQEDGTNCTSDSQCGSGICSGMGICSKSRDDCAPYGLSLCNKKCVSREIKLFGEPASCDFECKSGFIEFGKCKTCDGGECFKEGASCERSTQCGSGTCNANGECGSFTGCKGNTSFCNVTNKCTLPSIKKEKEAYSCDFECISQRGNGEVCIWSLEKEAFWSKTKNIFFVILIFAGILWISYFIIWKRFYPLIKNWVEAKRELGNLQKEIEIDKESLQDLNEKIGKSAVEIESLKEEIKQSQGIAKKRLEEELEKQLVKQAERISEIKLKDTELEKDEERLLEKEMGIQKRNEIADEEIKATKKEIEAVIEKYGVLYGKKRIFYDGQSGYLKFADGNSPLHRYIYKNKFGMKYDSEIHHIDNKKLNNGVTNLIELSAEQHRKINHGKIIVGDWFSGIRAIKTALNWQDSDFPRHIQNEIDKRQSK